MFDTHKTARLHYYFNSEYKDFSTKMLSGKQ